MDPFLIVCQIQSISMPQVSITWMDINLIWNNKITAPIRAAPIISGKFFLVLAKDNRLYAYNLTNGELTWTHEGLEEISTFMGSSSPVVSKGIVIVTYSSGEIYAINLSNGQVIWNDNLITLIQKACYMTHYYS